MAAFIQGFFSGLVGSASSAKDSNPSDPPAVASRVQSAARSTIRHQQLSGSRSIQAIQKAAIPLNQAAKRQARSSALACSYREAGDKEATDWSQDPRSRAAEAARAEADRHVQNWKDHTDEALSSALDGRPFKAIDAAEQAWEERNQANELYWEANRLENEAAQDASEDGCVIQ